MSQSSTTSSRWAYLSPVTLMEECPRRVWMLLRFMLASMRRATWVRLRSWNRVLFGTVGTDPTRGFQTRLRQLSSRMGYRRVSRTMRREPGVLRGDSDACSHSIKDA